MLLLLITLLPIFLHLCSATSLLVSIPPSTHLPNPNTLSPLTHANLLSGLPHVAPLTAPLTTRLTLEFHNLTIRDSSLTPISYLLTISAPSHVFASYRVDIIPSGSSNGDAVIEGIWETYPGSAWSDKGPILGGKAAQGGGASGAVSSVRSTKSEPEQGQVVNIEAKVLARREFYEQRAGFNPLGLLMNPMVLLGAVAMGITFGMPYLMDNSMSCPISPPCLSPSALFPLMTSPAPIHLKLTHLLQPQSIPNSKPNSKSRRKTAPYLACTMPSKQPLEAVPPAVREGPVTSIWRAGWRERRRVSRVLRVVRR
jgi:ER membrane protein complex subunit 7